MDSSGTVILLSARVFFIGWVVLRSYNSSVLITKTQYARRLVGDNQIVKKREDA